MALGSHGVLIFEVGPEVVVDDREHWAAGIGHAKASSAIFGLGVEMLKNSATWQEVYGALPNMELCSL